MLKHHLKLALRNFWRFKSYSFVNLLGLSIGLTTTILIILFVMDELSFDQFHVNKDRIYKVVTQTQGGGMETNARPVGYRLKTDFPEVEDLTYSLRATRLTVYHDGERNNHEMFYTDNSFLNIFTFPMIEGDPNSALSKPKSVVITKEIRDLYFGESQALGKTMIFQDSVEFTVAGVVENIPAQSHIQFDILISWNTIFKNGTVFEGGDDWGTFDSRNYILVKNGIDVQTFKQKASALYITHISDMMEQMGLSFTVDFIPLEEVYLNEHFGNGFGPSGSLQRVKLVSVIAVLILLLGCINFINLTTSRSVYRAREVGIKKINGSTQKGLMWQFMFETFVIAVFSFLVALVMAELSLPLFNSLLSKGYSFTSLLTLEFAIAAVALIAFVAIASGLYPALVLSGMKSLEAVKGKIQHRKSGAKIRKTLVIAQFSISAAMILGTFLVLSQLKYMKDKELGFAKDQILVINGQNVPKTMDTGIIVEKLTNISGINRASFTNSLPGRPGWLGQWAYPEEIAKETQVDTEYMAIDENFIEVMDLTLIAGRNFDLQSPSDLRDGLIINETCVKEMGWASAEEAIGKQIVSPSTTPQGTVIGVVKDYHGLGLQQRIWPQAMDYASHLYGRYYALNISDNVNVSNLLENINLVWAEIYPDHSLDFFFLDQDFDRQYRAEERLMQVFIIFSVIALIIALIGLVGMVSFTIQNRLKEISVRKVHGASALSVSNRLSAEFLVLILIANVIIVLPAWYYANEWLNSFAFRTELNPLTFMASMAIMIVIALVAISYQTIKAAFTNPAEVLRNE